MKSRLLVFVPGLLLSAVLFSATPVGLDEDIVTLPEFAVSSTSLADDYIITEATTGSRLGEDITKIPFNVDVITTEMMEDFQLDNIEDLMRFMGGAGGDVPDPDGGDLAEGSYGGRVRGFIPLTVRDGFQFAMPTSFANIGSVEFIRGPQSVFFGRAEPGGIINRITAKPSFKQRTTLSATYSFPNDFYRFYISASGPVIKNKLLYRTYFGYSKRKGSDWIGPIDFAVSETYSAGISLLYRFRPTTTLYLSVEMQPSSGKQAYRFTEVFDARTALANGQLKTTRDFTDLSEFNGIYADNAYRDTDYYGLNLLFNHRINKIWETRSAIQTYNRKVEYLRYVGAADLYLYDPIYNPALGPDAPTFTFNKYTGGPTGTNYVDGATYNDFVYNGTFSTRYPYYREERDECVALQADAKATFKRPRSTHTLLFAADGSIRKRDYQNYIYYASGADTGAPPIPGVLRLSVDPGNSGFRPIDHGSQYYGVDFGTGAMLDPLYYHSTLPEYKDDPTLFWKTVDTEMEMITAGAFSSYRGSFLRNRLHVMAGLRFESYKDEIRDWRNKTYTSNITLPIEPGIDPTPQSYYAAPSTSGHKFTYSAGVTYQLARERIGLFASTSTSYRPKMDIDRGMNTMLVPQEATAYEVGIKGVFTNSRGGKLLVYTLSAYDIVLRNISVANEEYVSGVHDGLGLVPQYLVAGEQKSQGVDLRIVYNPSPRFMISAAFNYCDNIVTRSTTSSNFVGGRPTALVPKYNASFFSRYAFGGKLRGLRVGLAGTWRDRVTAYYEGSTLYGAELPSLLLMQGFATYRINLPKGRYHEISFNVNNLLDKEYHTRVGRPYDGRNYRLSYKVSF